MKKPHYIREWRRFRGMTMDELATRLDISAVALGRIERGDQRYNQHFLEAAAGALNSTPGDLIMRDPGSEAPLGQHIASLDYRDREMLAAIVKTMTAARPAVQPDRNEEAIIGAMLYDPIWAARAAPLLPAEAFENPVLQQAHKAILETVALGEWAEPLTVDRRAKKYGHWPDDGVQYLAELVSAAPSHHLVHGTIARMVSEYTLRRLRADNEH